MIEVVLTRRTWITSISFGHVFSLHSPNYETTWIIQIHLLGPNIGEVIKEPEGKGKLCNASALASICFVRGWFRCNVRTVSDSETLDKWQVFFGYLAIMPWDFLCFWGGWSGIKYNLCWGVFFRFFRHSMYSWRLSYRTSRLWQAAWDLTQTVTWANPSSRNFHLEVDKVYLIEYP